MAYTYSIDDPAKNSKRTRAFVLVVIIHVLFFWVLASGLGAKIVEVAMGPVGTKLIEELPDDDKEPQRHDRLGGLFRSGLSLLPGTPLASRDPRQRP